MTQKEKKDVARESKKGNERREKRKKERKGRKESEGWRHHAHAGVFLTASKKKSITCCL